MVPSETERDTLFKHFGRAFFKQDLDAMYAVVTADFTYSIVVNDVSRLMCTRDQVAAFFIERNDAQQNVRFEDVVFHHADEATFMTYRVTGTDLVTNESFERVGVERYTFKDGRIAEKDVYSRPV
jgi:ketosteroid isomerase-like protein